jgi:hypothetical protein
MSKTIKVFLFSELSEAAKKTAINNHEIDWDWYQWIKDDAKTEFGIEILYFDLDQMSIKLYIKSYQETASKIMNSDFERLKEAIKDVDLSSLDIEDDQNNNPLKKPLGKFYLKVLEAEHELLQTEEYLQDHFDINECYFTKTGKIVQNKDL